MAKSREAVESPIPNSDGTIIRKFITEGSIDPVEAQNAAYAAADPTYLGRVRIGIANVRIPARGVWEHEFLYAPPGPDTGEPTGDQPTLGTIEIDSSGGTQHITQAYQNAVYGVTDQNQNVAGTLYSNSVIGFNKDGVAGVDIDVRGTTYVLTKKFLPETISGQYLYNLSQLRGKINYYYWTLNWGQGNATYSIQFEPAELRFLHHTAKLGVTAKGLSCWDISYTLYHVANRYNFFVGNSVFVPFKGGQHYLWVLYKKTSVAGGVIETPDLVCQSRVYEWEDFAAVLGF